jgi:transcriptional regulator with XRE-family HTH domain
MKTTYTKKENDFLKDVGQNIRDARQSIELSQEKFAQVCKLDRTYISDVERGERNISLLNLRKIALALNVPPSELMPVV